MGMVMQQCGPHIGQWHTVTWGDDDLCTVLAENGLGARDCPANAAIPEFATSSQSAAKTPQQKPSPRQFLMRKIITSDLRRFYLSASAPPTISAISLVMVAWRARLSERVRPEIILPALSVALDIDVMRAPCSDAMLSTTA